MTDRLQWHIDNALDIDRTNEFVGWWVRHHDWRTVRERAIQLRRIARRADREGLGGRLFFIAGYLKQTAKTRKHTIKEVAR